VPAQAGNITPASDVKCPDCRGGGLRYFEVQYKWGPGWQSEKCNGCNGKGLVPRSYLAWRGWHWQLNEEKKRLRLELDIQHVEHRALQRKGLVVVAVVASALIAFVAAVTGEHSLWNIFGGATVVAVAAWVAWIKANGWVRELEQRLSERLAGWEREHPRPIRGPWPYGVTDGRP
jgi:hypothetical protein